MSEGVIGGMGAWGGGGVGWVGWVGAPHEAHLCLLLLLEQVLLLRTLLSLQVAVEVLQLATLLLQVVDAPG